jgi:hypothetical protein
VSKNNLSSKNKIKNIILAISLGTFFSAVVIAFFAYSLEKYLISNRNQIGAQYQKKINDDLSYIDLYKNSKIGHFPIQPPSVNSPYKKIKTEFWPGQFYTEMTPNDARQISELGVFKLPTKNYRSVRKLTDSKEVVWDVKYQIEHNYRRRLTPGEIAKNPKMVDRGFIILGDSQIFGEGLNDDETLAAQLGKKVPQVRFYNYAIPGLFPGEALDRIRLIKGSGPNQEIQETKNTLVYFYSHYHIYRSIATLNQIAFWGYYKPYYFKNEHGDIVQNETIKKALPIRSWFADIFAGLALTQHYRLTWPSLTDDDWYFFVDLLKQIHQNSLRLGVDKFYVILYPDNNPLSIALIKFLEHEKIPYISYAHWKIQQLTEKPTIIPNESHANTEFNRLFAQTLSQQDYLFIQ